VVAPKAGYSGTPLIQKLGIKANSRVLLFGAPTEFSLGSLPAGAKLAPARGAGRADVVLCFAKDQRALVSRFAPAAERLETNGGLWVAWPKKASGVTTDLDENLVRELGLSAGLVDNKVCAIDATWSGLRFVVRLRDRPRK
jgi:hypothetical protein